MLMNLPLSLVLLASGAYQPAFATTSDTHVVRASPALKAGRAKSASTIKPGDCYLRVDGVVLVDNGCSVYPMGDGGYTLNSWDRGKPRRSHFAVVSVIANDKADATWNADPDDDRAMDPLGQVAMRRGCWQNARARICARKVRRSR